MRAYVIVPRILHERHQWHIGAVQVVHAVRVTVAVDPREAVVLAVERVGDPAAAGDDTQRVQHVRPLSLGVVHVIPQAAHQHHVAKVKTILDERVPADRLLEVHVEEGLAGQRVVVVPRVVPGMLTTQLEPVVPVQLPVDRRLRDEPVLGADVQRAAARARLRPAQGAEAAVPVLVDRVVLVRIQRVVGRAPGPQPVELGVVEKRGVEREALEVEHQVQRRDHEAAEVIPRRKLRLCGQREAVEVPVLLVGDACVERERPLSRLGQVLGPVQLVNPAPVAVGPDGGQVSVGGDAAPGLALAGKHQRRNPRAGAERVVQLALHVVRTARVARVARSGAVSTVVVHDLLIHAVREQVAPAPRDRQVVHVDLSRIRGRVARCNRYGNRRVHTGIDERRVVLGVGPAEAGPVARDGAGQIERQAAHERAAKAGVDAVEAHALRVREHLIGFPAQRAIECRGRAGLGNDVDDARLGISVLGRAGAGRHRGLFEAALRDFDAAANAHQERAAVARTGWHAIDIRGSLVGPAAADGDGVARSGGNHARLQRQHLADVVHRQGVGELTADALPGRDLVPGNQGRLARHHDVLDLDRGLREREIDGRGLAGQHPDAVRTHGAIADEGRAHRVRASGHVVHEIVALGIREGAERLPHDCDLGIRDGRARLIPNPALDFTSRLGRQRRNAKAERDCRERASARNASEGSYTALLHGNVLQRREPAGTANLERG